jgi:hypothetical protein
MVIEPFPFYIYLDADSGLKASPDRSTNDSPDKLKFVIMANTASDRYLGFVSEAEFEHKIEVLIPDASNIYAAVFNKQDGQFRYKIDAFMRHCGPQCRGRWSASWFAFEGRDVKLSLSFDDERDAAVIMLMGHALVRP